MVEILDAIPEEQVVSLYEGLARHHASFVWPHHLHGIAYNLTLESLFKRAAAARVAVG